MHANKSVEQCKAEKQPSGSQINWVPGAYHAQLELGTTIASSSYAVDEFDFIPLLSRSLSPRRYTL